MGCSNYVSIQNIVQIIASIFLPTPTPGWKHVSADKRYEEKYWTKIDRRTGEELIGRMERPIGQNVSDYPHFTEFFHKDGKRINYTEEGDKETNWGAHYSYNKNTHVGAHKTAQAKIDDLEALLK